MPICGQRMKSRGGNNTSERVHFPLAEIEGKIMNKMKGNYEPIYHNFCEDDQWNGFTKLWLTYFGKNIRYLEIQVNLFGDQDGNTAVFGIDGRAQCHKSQDEASQRARPYKYFQIALPVL